MAKEFPVQGDDLKKIVKKSRTMPIAFGFNPGTTDEDDEYLAAHPRKTAEMLGKLALHDGAGTKTAFGSFQAVSSELRMTCFRTLPQLAKKIKRYLKRNKINLNVVVMDPDGNMIDCDIEVLTAWDEDDAGAGSPEAEALAAVDEVTPEVEARLAALDAAPDPATDPRELALRLKAIQPELALVPAQLAERVQAGFGAAAAMIRARQLVEAEAAISKLEMVMARLAMARQGTAAPAAAPAAAPGLAEDARLPKLREAVDRLSARLADLTGTDALAARLGQAVARLDAGDAQAAMGIIREVQAAMTAAQAEAETWAKAEATLAPRIAEALSRRSIADPDGLRARWAVVGGLAGDGQWARALAALPGIVQMLRTPAAAPEVEAGTAAFQQARALWVGTRTQMMAEAQKLADAIVAQSADDPDADEVAGAAQELLREVAVIDARLQEVLDRLTTAAPAERPALKREAKAIVADYQSRLSQGLFAEIDANPFAPVAVTARARAALGQIAATLAA